MPSQIDNNNYEITEATVARIDERTKSIQTELIQIRLDLKENLDTVIDRVRDVDKRHGDKLLDVVERHDELAKKIEEEYVKKEEFDLIKKIVYGFIALIVITVVTTLLATVVISPTKERAARNAESIMRNSDTLKMIEKEALSPNH